MALEIDQSIIERTPCPYDFICLSGDTETICKVEKDGGFFVCVFPKKKLPAYCPFKLQLITLCLCECDVRLAIYHKYRI